MEMLGLFAARGEIASTFQTRADVAGELSATGFANAEVIDLSDIYRITTATRPGCRLTDGCSRPPGGRCRACSLAG